MTARLLPLDALSGQTWFNPDTSARALMATRPMPLEDANADAWQFGREHLEEAIAILSNFAFETTLGARTIPRIPDGAKPLLEAAIRLQESR